MSYTVNKLHVLKSEILPKWMTNIFYSQFAMVLHAFHDYKLWKAAETHIWQSLKSQSDRNLVTLWIDPCNIEPTEISSRSWQNVYRSKIAFCHKIFKWWPGLFIHSWNLSFRISIISTMQEGSFIRFYHGHDWIFLCIENHFDYLCKISGQMT